MYDRSSMEIKQADTLVREQAFSQIKIISEVNCSLITTSSYIKQNEKQEYSE